MNCPLTFEAADLVESARASGAPLDAVFWPPEKIAGLEREMVECGTKPFKSKLPHLRYAGVPFKPIEVVV